MGASASKSIIFINYVLKLTSLVYGTYIGTAWRACVVRDAWCAVRAGLVCAGAVCYALLLLLLLPFTPAS